MNHYGVFLALAATAVLSPGPGVALTITNSLRYGVNNALAGIFGLAVGALILAAISASGVGIILAASSIAFTIMKYVGAAYLFYLGVKMWLSPEATAKVQTPTAANRRIRFLEALSLQLSNPKAIFFFVSIFPQFIDTASPSLMQFSGLVFSYCFLIFIIHSLYALLASKASRWLSSSKGNQALSRIGGTAFIFFGLALASSKL
jgi:threonine/homoserine/homoserine lactone efflux protein